MSSVSASEENRPIRDDLVCWKRPLLNKVAKRCKIRGYSKIKKCELQKALIEYTSNPSAYPLAGKRKTRDIDSLLGRRRARASRKKRPKPQKKPKKRRVVYESDSDEDVPLVPKARHANDWSQDTVQ